MTIWPLGQELCRVEQFVHPRIASTSDQNSISFKVFSGEFHAIVGLSGSGKSTLLNAIIGIPSDIGGPSFPKERITRHASVAACYQDGFLLPWLTTEQNVALPLRSNRLSMPSTNHDVRVALKTVRLDPDRVLNLFPDQLSGGMRSRVSLARALISGCQLIVLDEPLSAVDEIASHDVHLVLRQVADSGRSVVMATHNITEALLHANIMFALTTTATAANPFWNLNEILGPTKARDLGSSSLINLRKDIWEALKQ